MGALVALVVFAGLPPDGGAAVVELKPEAGPRCEAQMKAARFTVMLDRVELARAAQTVADATCSTIVVPGGARQTISALTPGALSPQDFFALFIAAVEAEGLAVFAGGYRAFVVAPPPAGGGRRRITPRSLKEAPELVIHTFPLRHAEPRELGDYLDVQLPGKARLASEGAPAPAAANERVTRVVVMGTPDQVERIGRLILYLDTPLETEGTKHVDASPIRRNAEGELEAPRELVGQVLSNLIGVLAQAHAMPLMKGAQLDGLEVMGPNAGSVAAALGFKSEDVVRRVNGIALSDSRRLRELFLSVRDGERIELEIERDGGTVTQTCLVTDPAKP